MEKIGFIGLGIMGRPMALNLCAAGYQLFVYDVAATDAVRQLTDAGATAVASSREAAEQSDVIITMLPNSPHVQDAVLGPGGVAEGARKGTIYVDMSSIDPGVSQELSAEVARNGVVMFDAPVSGGEPKAIDGTLSIMVGGPADHFDRIESILLTMGASAVLVGEIGSGNVTKLANQIIVGLNIAAMSEAMVLAKKAAVDPERVFNAIRGGLAGSTVLDAKMPLVLDGNFAPGFRIELHIKDLANALNAGHAVGAPLPLTAGVMEIMQACKVAGHEREDHSGLIQFYEEMAKVEVRRMTTGSQNVELE